MNLIEIPLQLKKLNKNSDDVRRLQNFEENRKTVASLVAENRIFDAIERTIESLRELRDFSDYENIEFQAAVVALLFDLAELHFEHKDYKQAEKELDVIFKMLEKLIAIDAERFGHFHILAMELSTRILRSRKKSMDLLVRQQLQTSLLYDKVNAGVIAATDKLVESLRRVGQLLASTGDYRAAMKFYAEAIRFSKRRTGKVTRKEIKMTIEMAEIMMRISSLRPRAARLLNAILAHAIALETIELEEDILALLEIIRADIAREPKWKVFIHNISKPLRKRLTKEEKRIEGEMKKAEKMHKAEEKKIEKLNREAEKTKKKAEKIEKKKEEKEAKK